MWVVGSVERLSDHPLPGAEAGDGEQFFDGQRVLAATDLSSLTGRVVQARGNGEMVLIGKAEMFGRDGFAALSAETVRTIERLRDQGRTTMAVRIGDRDLGAIGLMDPPRAAAKEAIARLKILGKIGRVHV